MSTINFEPIGQYILAKPVPVSEMTTQSGLYLTGAGSADQFSELVTIIKLGSGRLNDNGDKIPFRVKEGDEVYIRKYMGLDYENGFDKYLVIDEDAILGFKR